MKRSSASTDEATMRRLERKKALNRLNALKSTGPKSQEGKSRSAQNARTHGFTALKEPAKVKGMDEAGFCALILGADPSALEQTEKGPELVLLAKALYDTQTRLNAIRQKKAKIYDELNRPQSIFAITSPSTANPFISGTRQAQRVIAEWKRTSNTSKQKQLIAPAARILLTVGNALPNHLELLRKLTRYERETLARSRKLARLIEMLKVQRIEQLAPDKGQSPTAASSAKTCR
jgi:hypothetical protein